jgi:hypothetical protein
MTAKGISGRITRFDKAFSSEAKLHYRLLIPSDESDISNLKEVQKENYFK